EFYWNEWINDPQVRCEPCDMDGHFIGPRSNCCKPRYFIQNGWRFLWGYRADKCGDADCFNGGRPCCEKRAKHGTCGCGGHGHGHDQNYGYDHGYEEVYEGETIIEGESSVRTMKSTPATPRRSL